MHDVISDTVLFEPTSRFSNDSFTPIFYNGVEFKTMTHFLEFHKAIKFKRPSQCKDVLTAATADKSETFAANMLYADLNQWYTEAEELAIKGLRCKFKQHPALMASLLKTGSSDLVSCTVQTDFGESAWLATRPPG